jgi:hypothetical protein
MNRERKLQLLFFVSVMGGFIAGWVLADLTRPLLP